MASRAIQDKPMIKKESIEINCAACMAHFRLWVPAEMLPEWEKGANINCIKCGSRLFIRKSKGAFEINPAAAQNVQTVQANKVLQTVQAVQTQAPAAPKEPSAMVEPHVPEVPAKPISSNADSVLLIEDDALTMRMIEDVLKDMGIRLIAARNSVEALKIIKREKIKLVVTDLYLKDPGDKDSVDGAEMLQKICDMGINVPAIITTGKAILDDMVLDPKWFDLRVKGFIQKGNPFWAEELKLKIKEALYKD